MHSMEECNGSEYRTCMQVCSGGCNGNEFLNVCSYLLYGSTSVHGRVQWHDELKSANNESESQYQLIKCAVEVKCL